MDQKQIWSGLARRLVPYIPGEQPDASLRWVKLNTNENPYPPSQKTLEAANAALNAKLRMYPDPESVDLRKAIAAHHGVQTDQVFVGNGSDEVLAVCFQAFFDPGQAVGVPDITYFFYEVYAQLYDIDLNIVPLQEDFSLPVDALCQSKGGVVFANPNAPTGMIASLADIERIAASTTRVVIVDEAYIDFGGKSALPLLEKHPNIVVCRTFSKSYSLAGLRVGYAIASAGLVEAMNRVKNAFNSFPIDRVAQAAAQAAIEDHVYYEQCTAKIIRTREASQRHLLELGFAILPSEANFLFATHSKYEAASLQKKLREMQIIVRQFSRPRIDNFLRITIGTDEEMEALFAALKEVMD